MLVTSVHCQPINSQELIVLVLELVNYEILLVVSENEIGIFNVILDVLFTFTVSIIKVSIIIIAFFESQY